MAIDMRHAPVRQAQEDNKKRTVDALDARQGAVSGRVITVLLVSTVLVAIIFAIIWLRGA